MYKVGGAMIRKTIFICEKCNKQYDVAMDACKCEADHLGLTLKEYKEYYKLLEIERNCNANISIMKDEKTERLLENAINAVLEFKKLHNIIDDK